MEISSKFIATKYHIDGTPKESDFELKNEIISLGTDSKKVVVKNLYVSIDPYQLNRMKTQSSSQKASSFSLGINPGEEIDTFGVGKVVSSGNPEFQTDDLVTGLLTWGEYTVVEEGCRVVGVEDPGFSGLTAYGGLFEVCKPKKGEKVFVSAASGSVGHLVGQYAKLHGCYVVGSAGSQKKVQVLKEELGFDDAFNYKEEPDLKAALKRYFPDGIDIYFDNVGAEMLEAAVANMNAYGRVGACGVISEYTNTTKRAAPDMLDVVYKRITIQGFLAADHMKVYGEFLSTTTEHLKTGQMKSLEDISHGIDSIPSAFVGLFRGNNVGKMIVQIAED